MAGSALASSRGRSNAILRLSTWHATPAAVMLSFGDPTPFIGRIKAAGCKIICQVQTLAQVSGKRDLYGH